jgi:isopentenyl-diphosphate Delta-isomerase
VAAVETATPHLRLAFEPQVPAGLEHLRLSHRALPERDLAEVSLRTRLLGAELAAPVVLAAADGSSRDLARTAREHGLGLVLPCGRSLLDDGAPISHFRTPDRPPLLLARLAFAALGRDGPARAERLVAMLDADGIAIELGGVDEALAPGGDPRYRGATELVAAVAERLAPVPVLVSETGYGMDAADVRALRRAGAAGVALGGVTAPPDPAFASWGIPPADAIAEAALAADGLPVIAGAPRDGVQAAICLALGATAVSIAAFAPEHLHQLRVATWAAGEPAPAALTQGHLRRAS